MTRAEVTVYDVGHGDHILLVLENDGQVFRAIIDCNWPAASRFDPPALARLKAEGVGQLDLLVASHPHRDHLMGLSRIAEYFTTPPRRLRRYMDFGLDLRALAKKSRGSLKKELKALYTHTIGLCKAGSENAPAYFPLMSSCAEIPILGDRVSLAVIAPKEETWKAEHRKVLAGRPISPNRVSSVLLWRVFGSALIFGGDLEGPEWRKVIGDAQGLDLRADFIKLGHHGARNGSPPELWQCVPRAYPKVTTAAISTRGTPHHPDPRTLFDVIEARSRPVCTNYGPFCEPLMPGKQREAAMSGLAATKKQAFRQLGRTTLGVRRKADRRCFGTATFDVRADQVMVESAVPGARCHLRQRVIEGVGCALELSRLFM